MWNRVYRKVAEFKFVLLEQWATSFNRYPTFDWTEKIYGAPNDSESVEQIESGESKKNSRIYIYHYRKKMNNIKNMYYWPHEIIE